RPKNMDRSPDLPSYDLVVSYQPPYVDLNPRRILGIKMKWQLRGSSRGAGKFAYSSPAAHGANCQVAFEPQAVRVGERTRVRVPGLASVPVNALFRIVTGKQSKK